METHAWTIVAASFFCLFFNTGTNYAVGVLHLGLLETYPDDEHLIVWLGSLYGAMFALTGPVASLVINLYNCRTCAVLSGLLGFVGFVSSYFVPSVSWLFLTYAFIVGLGHGLANTASIVILGYYFQDNSLVNGISVSGVGLGILVYPVLTSKLLTLYGLHGTFLILGGMASQSCVFGILMRPSKFERSRHLKFSSGHNRRQTIINAICGGDVTQFGTILTNIPFACFLTSVMAFSMYLSAIYLYLPDYFVQSGSTHEIASLSISVSGIGSIIARFLTGFAANDPQVGCLLLFAGTTGISGFLMLSIKLFSATSAGQLIYGFLLGLYTGGIWVMCGPVTLSILGAERLSNGYGLVMLVVGISYLLGPPLAGLILKLNNHYFSVFLFCAVMTFLSAIFCFLTALTKPRLIKESDVRNSDLDLKVTAVNDLELSYLREKTYLDDTDSIEKGEIDATDRNEFACNQ